MTRDLQIISYEFKNQSYKSEIINDKLNITNYDNKYRVFCQSESNQQKKYQKNFKNNSSHVIY